MPARLENNEFADTVTAALASVFPEDPPRFLARTPYAYHDASRLEEATDVAAEAIGRRFRRGAVEGQMQAHVVTVER